MPLSKTVVDVFLGTVNQVPGPHSDSTGRLTSLKDCQIRRYSGKPERVVVEARHGFQSLPTEMHSSVTGAIASGTWASPELLGSLQDQLVAVASQVPRVYTGSGYWTEYSDTRVVSDQLSEQVYHTSDHTIQAPDGAWLAGVTCFTWTETSYADSGLPLTSSWVGFKSDADVWVTLPRQLAAGSTTSVICQAKVVTDGALFWVFWNSKPAGYNINVAVYDTNGYQLALDSITQDWHGTPGYWDVTYQAGKVMLAQPAGYGPLSEVNVRLTKWVYAAGPGITKTSHIDTTMHCRGPIAWLTNDLANGSGYLATCGIGEGGDRFWGYEVNPTTLMQTHEYDTAWTATTPDSVTGYVDSNLDMYMSYSELAVHAGTGPGYDPARRNTTTILSPRSTGTATRVRTSESVVQVSRAFKRDNDYYVFTYYQSGTGLTLTPTVIEVTMTSGDYMLGNGTQPVTLRNRDFTTGASFSIGSQTAPVSVRVSDAYGSFSITPGSSVTQVSATGLVPAYGVADGTPLLEWTMTGQAFGTSHVGSKLTVTGSSGVTGADGSYYIVGVVTPGGGPSFFTLARNGTNVFPSGTFSAGTAVAASMTNYLCLPLEGGISTDTRAFFVGGTFAVAGSAIPGNNGTKTIARVLLRADIANATPDSIWVPYTAEVTETGSWSATVSPVTVKQWTFAGSTFTLSDIGSSLVVAGGAEPRNDGIFAITSVPNNTTLFTAGDDAGGTVAEYFNIFNGTDPTVSIQLPSDKTQYTFSFATVTFDQSYIGGLIQVTGSLNHPNDGIYRILSLDDTDMSHHRVFAEPTNGKVDQVNESWDSDSFPFVTIQLRNGVGPEFQPVWFMTPLTAKYAQVGCFERGLAYSDWRYEGQTDIDQANLYSMSVSSPFMTSSGLGTILPYRAKSFTSTQPVPAPNGINTNVSIAIQESTVGLKQFRLGPTLGQPVQAFNELMLPGPLGGGFTDSGFHEQGINLGPELPYLISQEHDSSVFGVTPGPIILQVVYEVTDENGERIFSYPSPALSFTLQSPNNTYLVGGRLPLPYLPSGLLAPDTYGITNRPNISICLYRTATINGIPTTQRFKVTNDLNPNGLRSGYATGQGFYFDDVVTWTYRDQSLDTAIVEAEALYTTKGLLPRWPAPAFSQGDVWENRTWLVGYDGAVWVSGEKTEGDGNWFFPGLRITCPDKIKTVSRMEQYAVLGCASSMWYVPAQQLPSSTGGNGALPTPSPLPFQNGCTGHAVTINAGVVYSSSAGGVWLITRDLQNKWLSEPIKDQLGSSTVTGLAVDKLQRVLVSTSAGTVYVYDPVPGAWYTWTLPSSTDLVTSWQGLFTYQDGGCVSFQSLDYNDNRLAVVTGIAPDLTLAGLSFAHVRNAKRCWEIQLVGEFKGPHSLNAVISYPDDAPASPTTFGPFPVMTDPGPYLWAINPGMEEAGQYGVRVYASFEGIENPGDSFALELLSCEIGVDGRQGLLKRPASSRIVRN